MNKKYFHLVLMDKKCLASISPMNLNSNKSYNIALAKGAILWAFYTQDPEFYILLCFYSHSLLSSGEIYCLFWKINQNFIKFHPGWFIYIKYKLYNICHSVVFSSQEMHVLYYGSKIWQLLNEISFRVFKIKLRASSFHWTSDNFGDVFIDNLKVKLAYEFSFCKAVRLWPTTSR